MKTLLFLTILSSVLFSCKKDKAPVGPSIEIGDSKGLIVTERDVIVNASDAQYPSQAAVDLGDDGTKDILIKSMWTIGPQQTWLKYYLIETIHDDCAFAGYEENDSTWVKWDTSHIVNGSGQILTYWMENLACTHLDSDYSLDTVVYDKIHTHAFYGGETLHLNDYFSTEVQSFALPSDLYTGAWYQYTSNDTLYHSGPYYHNEMCNIVQDNFAGYLGFKLNTLKGPKLGWVKLQITDKHIVEITETAIQP